MATLILSTVGTAVGGPIGSAIGAFIGQQVDQAIFGSGSREGPRLKELSVTTSSYGQPITRLFGRMRVPGTIIWSTDLIESSEKTGGGKGQPSTKTYNYSASFAVALSSTPISSLGRVWADGELLRGEAGDLKVEGKVRVYNGHGNDPIDPIIGADRGGDAPAFRDCAYVVFESLQLADFGNRIPALTFEIMAEDNSSVSLGDIVPRTNRSDSSEVLEHFLGFADEGGSVASSLSMIDRVFPFACVTEADGLKLDRIKSTDSVVTALPEQWLDQSRDSRNRNRGERTGAEPQAIRYYDEARDYQPGVQRAIGSRSNGRESMIDIPAAMTADGARSIANANAQRARWHNEQLVWTLADLDPDIIPGSIVSVPQTPGRWLVKTWEWNDRGVELGLERVAPNLPSSVSSDAGTANTLADEVVGPTMLRAFELPSDGTSPSSQPTVLVAATSETSAWRGAMLYVDQADGLLTLEPASRARSITGHLASDLAASDATHLEAQASLIVDLPDSVLAFGETTVAGLALGSNRLLVGSEVVQFLFAEPIEPARWKLSGLLRGQGGTEDAAAKGHKARTPVTLIDEGLTPLDSSQVQSNTATRIAAIGLGDADPVYSQLENVGLSRRPLAPVHPRCTQKADGSLEFCWTRRGRGQWLWEDGVDVPLLEEREAYIVGYGPTEAPVRAWTVTESRISMTSSEITDLVAIHGAQAVWVQQSGTFSKSPAVLLKTLT